jgi:hypothetical protein
MRSVESQRSRGSSVSIVTRLHPGETGFDSQKGQGVFLFATTSRLALEPNQPPIQLVRRTLCPGIKRPEHEADHSP